MDNAALKPGDRVAVWFYVTHATAHDVWLANKPGKPAIVDAPVSDIITAARRPALPDREAVELILRDTLFVRHGYDAGNFVQDVGGIGDAADAILAMLSAAPKEPDHG